MAEFKSNVNVITSIVAVAMVVYILWFIDYTTATYDVTMGDISKRLDIHLVLILYLMYIKKDD